MGFSPGEVSGNFRKVAWSIGGGAGAGFVNSALVGVPAGGTHLWQGGRGAPCLYLRPQFQQRENQRGKGEGPREGERGRVPGRRSRCCGFAEVLGFSRAELYGTNIGIREHKMAAR